MLCISVLFATIIFTEITVNHGSPWFQISTQLSDFAILVAYIVYMPDISGAHFLFIKLSQIVYGTIYTYFHSMFSTFIGTSQSFQHWLLSIHTKRCLHSDHELQNQFGSLNTDYIHDTCTLLILGCQLCSKGLALFYLDLSHWALPENTTFPVLVEHFHDADICMCRDQWALEEWPKMGNLWCRKHECLGSYWETFCGYFHSLLPFQFASCYSFFLPCCHGTIVISFEKVCYWGFS